MGYVNWIHCTAEDDKPLKDCAVCS